VLCGLIGASDNGRGCLIIYLIGYTGVLLPSFGYSTKVIAMRFYVPVFLITGYAIMNRCGNQEEYFSF
jgi:hypothetical protein